MFNIYTVTWWALWCSYLIVGPTAGRQQQQSQSWESENRHASHPSRPAGHRPSFHSEERYTEFEPKNTNSWGFTHWKKKCRLLHCILLQTFELTLDSSVWTCAASLQVFIQCTCTNASLSPNMDYLGTEKAKESAKLTGLSVTYGSDTYMWIC